MRCIHPSQRFISSRQMTDNIFEIETTALAHVACAPQESGILLTDFAAAYPSVNHSWIFSVLENTGWPGFLCRFLRRIYSDSIMHVEFGGAARGQFPVTRLSSEWLPTIRSSDGSQSQLTQGTQTTCNFCSLPKCAYADDLAVASISSRGLTTARTPASRSVDHIAGLNLNYRKCGWVQYGTERREPLWHWLSENCGEFREMQIVRRQI